MKSSGMMALWAGSLIPTPIGAGIMQLIKSVEVHDNFDGQSGFRITLGAERDATGYPILADSPLKPMGRVQIMFGWCLPGVPLINGVVTDRLLYPNVDNEGEIVIDGRDLSVLMDQEEKIKSFEDLAEPDAVAEILLPYLAEGVKPSIASPVADPPLESGRIPIQRGTDLDHLYAMAEQYGYAFGLRPGPEPFTNVAYWGPWQANGVTKPTLTAGLPYMNNVERLNVRQRGLAWTSVCGAVQDPLSDEYAPVAALTPSLRPLAANAPSQTSRRTRLLAADSGMSELQARNLSQGLVDRASMNAMALHGVLDVAVYGDFLRAGDKVPVRGMGMTADGDYMVAKVIHKLAPGSYRQEFTLKREGVDPTSPVVL